MAISLGDTSTNFVRFIRYFLPFLHSVFDHRFLLNAFERRNGVKENTNFVNSRDSLLRKNIWGQKPGSTWKKKKKKHLSTGRENHLPKHTITRLNTREANRALRWATLKGFEMGLDFFVCDAFSLLINYLKNLSYIWSLARRSFSKNFTPRQTITAKVLKYSWSVHFHLKKKLIDRSKE